MSLKKDGQLRREVLSIEWVDANREIVEGEIRFADYNVRFSLAPDELFLSEGIHVSYATVIDEIMSDADKAELRKAVQYGNATVVLFGEGRVPIDTAELSPVDDPLSE